MKVFEAEHWSRQPLDASMALLDDVVQIFALADGETYVSSILHRWPTRFFFCRKAASNGGA